MIRVQITSHKDLIQSITMTGHADSGEYGKDLVCAGASSIAIGALNALDEMFGNDCHLEMNENQIKIQVIKSTDCLQSCVMFLIKQLTMMTQTYPQYIKISRKEV